MTTSIPLLLPVAAVSPPLPPWNAPAGEKPPQMALRDRAANARCYKNMFNNEVNPIRNHPNYRFSHVCIFSIFQFIFHSFSHTYPILIPIFLLQRWVKSGQIFQLSEAQAMHCRRSAITFVAPPSIVRLHLGRWSRHLEMAGLCHCHWPSFGVSSR